MKIARRATRQAIDVGIDSLVLVEGRIQPQRREECEENQEISSHSSQ